MKLKLLYVSKYHSGLLSGSGSPFLVKLKKRLIEQGQIFLLGIAYLLEGLVILLSLGFIGTDLPAYLLFTVFNDLHIPRE